MLAEVEDLTGDSSVGAKETIAAGQETNNFTSDTILLVIESEGVKSRGEDLCKEPLH